MNRLFEPGEIGRNYKKVVRNMKYGIFTFEKKIIYLRNK